MDLIKALLRSNKRIDAVLQQIGIGNNQSTCRRLRSVNRAEISLYGLPSQELVQQMYDPSLSFMPLGGKKVLRILQCIKEIGSSRVLSSLKVAAAQPKVSLPTEGPSYLLNIHHFLDTRGPSSHLDVARTRYVKHVYFRAFQEAVDVLREKKELSRKEKRRKRDRQFPSIDAETPESDWIRNNYPNVDHTKNLTAMLVVQESIVGGICEQYGGSADIIKNDLKRYLAEGATLNLILHKLEPELLVLFPGDQYWDPGLTFDNLEDTAARAKLKKPIKVKEYVPISPRLSSLTSARFSIDALTEKEANWFGQVLPVLRPELYVPCAIPVATALIGLPSDADVRLKERDPAAYAAKPLEFLM